MPQPSDTEFELAIEKLKSHKSTGIDKIPVELIKAGGSTIRHEIHKLIISIWNKKELHLLLFHGYSGCTNTRDCFVLQTVPVLLV